MIKYWLQAARPQTLPAGISPVLLGLALAAQMTPLNFPVAFLTLITAMLLQISSNIINDYYDGIKGTDGPERLGPERVTITGKLSASQVKKGFLTTLSLSALAGGYLMYIGGWPAIIIGLTSLFFAWAYTGGPFPLSYYALGEVFAFFYFGIVPVWGTIYLQTLNSHTLSLPILLWGASIGLLASALMGINNLRDIDQDKKANKKTVATILGDKLMRKLISTFVLSSICMALFLIKTYAYVLLIPYFLFIRNWLEIKGGISGKSLNHNLKRTGQYLFLFSLVASLLITAQNNTLF